MPFNTNVGVFHILKDIKAKNHFKKVRKDGLFEVVDYDLQTLIFEVNKSICTQSYYNYLNILVSKKLIVYSSKKRDDVFNRKCRFYVFDKKLCEDFLSKNKFLEK
jgi:hypothetical protein